MRAFRKREDITIRRDEYSVRYSFADALSRYARINIEYFDTAERTDSDIIYEFNYWINKFPVPIFIYTSNSNEDIITPINQKESFLYGYKDLNGNLIYKFEPMPFPPEISNEDYFEEVYAEIPYITSEEIALRVNKEYNDLKRGVRIFNFAYFIVIFLIPLSWAIGGLLYDWIAFISVFYIFARSLYKALKYFGFIKKTKEEERKNEIAREKEHYYYHCKKNPDAFNRLRGENFSKH